MNVSPILLVVAACVCLIGVGAGLLVADRKSRLHRARLRSVTETYAPAVVQASRLGSARTARARPSRLRFAYDLLRILPQRPELYPAKWWVLAAVPAVVTAIGCVVLVSLVGSLGWLAYPIAFVFLARAVFGHFIARRAKLLYLQFPDALTMIVRSVRAGLPVPEALRVVGEDCQFPTSSEFTKLYDDLRLGGSMPDALRKLAERGKIVEYRFFAVALSLQSQSGGNLSEALENLADVIRKRVALRNRAMALAAEAKMSMYVLAGLPFVAVALIAVENPAYIGRLFYTSMGHGILLGGVILLTMGLVSMRVIISKSVS